MMCKPVGRYPGFHKIEIIAELEIPVIRQSVLRAIKSNCAHEAHIENNGTFSRFIPPNVYTPDSVLIRKLSGSSLVVSFYSNAWRTYGLKYLWEVNELQSVICDLGGQLMLVEPNEPEVVPASDIGGYGLNLHFYFNPMDIVADRFRIYPKDFPDHNSNPGEKKHIVRLADYLIDTFYKVVLSHINIRRDPGIRSSELQYA
ncbi:hypothetical protein ACFFGT_15050 [Mucilaginibacter angelicae]|uniref:Uncharacterized protein n=1 Tax=Mucilaginibacter angelicae TaxID=869718 RepID=A0ABV6L7X7_9SPHI